MYVCMYVCMYVLIYTSIHILYVVRNPCNLYRSEFSLSFLLSQAMRHDAQRRLQRAAKAGTKAVPLLDSELRALLVMQPDIRQGA